LQVRLPRCLALSATAFLGSWILPLTAHSDALRRFEGGDGTAGIHGPGGASARGLLDEVH
jgi:hypothetical protein